MMCCITILCSTMNWNNGAFAVARGFRFGINYKMLVCRLYTGIFIFLLPCFALKRFVNVITVKLINSKLR